MLFFVTSNEGKFREAKDIFGDELERVDMELEEPRGSLESIAIHKAVHAYSVLKKPLFVEDSGLFIDALNGFPGEFSSWALKKIGLEGILKLVPKERREAHFLSAVAYAHEGGVTLFKGRVDGHISEEVRGSSGFGYDPIFIPSGHDRTFGEDEGLKRNLSHRYYSLMALKNFLSQR